MRTRLAALWLIQLAGYGIPLISIPLLARRLGPDGWADLALAQSIGLAAGIFLEYGFNLSATREVSRHRHDRAVLREVIANTLGAQGLILAALVVLFGGLSGLLLPASDAAKGLLWWALLWTIPQSMGLQWLFQGLEEVVPAALVTLGARLAGLAGISWFVWTPADAGRAIACQSIPSMLALAPLIWWTMKRIGWGKPSWRGIGRSLQESASLCLYRVGLVGFAAAVPAILAAQHGAQELAWFSGADRLARATASFLDPLSAVLYPRWSRDSPRMAPGEAITSGLFSVVTAGAGLSLLLYLLAGPLVEWLLGPRFAPAAEVLAILAWLPLGQALAGVGGTQGLLALGGDRMVLASYLVTSSAALAWQWWFAPAAGGTGALCVALLAIQGLWFGSVLLRRCQIAKAAA